MNVVHEMGIASSILEAVRAEVDKRPGARASKIGLKLGELAGVDRESLTFCFEVLVKDTDLEPLALVIEDCAADELQLTYLELEE